jgi:hypothetical protein
LDNYWTLLEGDKKAAGKCTKAVRQPLGNSSRVLESHWEMSK